MDIPSALQQQRDFFKTGLTKDISYRRAALVRFRESIQRHEQDIINALISDFKKPPFETLATEVSVVLKELNLAIKDIWKWQLPKKIPPTLLNFPSSAQILYEPYGAVLIIAPWNYPFQLAIGPMIGAIAAGNTVVLKPSELTPATSALLETIITEVFDKNYVNIFQGDKEIAQQLLSKRWDYIFFTGSVAVGKIVYKAAAEHLTPVTLELGGKSPCIVDETSPIQQTAKRIVWGKFVNAGQTCIAPDYILVHTSKKEVLLNALTTEITKAYGTDPKDSEDFARIVNDQNFDRLVRLIDGTSVHTGGSSDRSDLYIAPTVLKDVTLKDPVMQDEIFGPILPVLTYNTMKDIERTINAMEKPLSAYVFTKKRSFKNWFYKTFSFGGGVTNDTLVHFINDKLGFGGVGNSGIGRYHGQQSFYTFSHTKGVVHRGTWLDVPLRYAPYKGKLALLKKCMRWL